MSFLRRQTDPNTLPSVFATYLTQSIPFRRKSRQSSTDSNFSTASTVSNSSAATSSSNPFTRCLTPTPIPALDDSSAIIPPDDKFLHGHNSHIHCAKCSTDLCLTSQVISKGFTGRHGRAFLVQGNASHVQTHTPALPNTYQNKNIPRNLVTGQHIVSDISCAICGSTLGWKYVEASEDSQKYKVGKFILETKRIRVGVSWEGEPEEDTPNPAYDDIMPMPPRDIKKPADPDQELEFDSQDEDECEDLFAGVWSPQLAAKRRQRKRERFGKRPVGGSGSGSGSVRSFGPASSTDTLS